MCVKRLTSLVFYRDSILNISQMHAIFDTFGVIHTNSINESLNFNRINRY